MNELNAAENETVTVILESLRLLQDVVLGVEQALFMYTVETLSNRYARINQSLKTVEVLLYKGYNVQRRVEELERFAAAVTQRPIRVTLAGLMTLHLRTLIGVRLLRQATGAELFTFQTPVGTISSALGWAVKHDFTILKT
ncbi:uncharacterized protein LOC117642871 [Thrips palmi]|uniref:Uncharacterized protein LOC117642871 n=1 Tax=Thrips palmi TaxID=161013 RepID=A0A6P8YKU4_THRPL|nr:uncharacterized protein LOC117642871 [Thrips palmi]